ncbi:MAG TPA: acyl carrier protein [Polyangium sp.]|nr:acyl carrier protein [Polyangium sp.]
MVTQQDVLQALEGTDVSTPIASLEMDVPLVSQGLDSLDIATLMLALESKYKKVIVPEQAARLRTVVDIVEFLNS